MYIRFPLHSFHTSTNIPNIMYLSSETHGCQVKTKKKILNWELFKKFVIMYFWGFENEYG